MISELPSLHVPLALICRFEPGASRLLEGFMEMELRVAEFTDSEAVPAALAPAKLKLALIFAVPILSPVAAPEDAPTVATEVLSELHLAVLVISCEEESLNTPVAVN